MNKLFTKITSLALGAAMMIGVGVAVGSKSQVVPAEAATSFGNDTITLGTNYWNAKTSSTYADNLGQTWTVSYTTSSLTNQANYIQFGSSNKPCTALSFATSGLTQAANLTAFEIVYGGSGKGASSTAELLVGSTSLKTGSGVSGATDETLSWSGTQEVAVNGTLNIAFSGLAKGVKVYSISYTIESASTEKYTVTYSDGNGGTYSVSNISSGATHNLVSLATTGFTAPTGKAFKCWSVGGTERDPGYGLVVTADTTVTALWADQRTLTYNANGGTNTMTDPNSPYGDGSTVTVLANEFTAPTGKRFSHWNTASDDTGTSYDPNDTFTINANTTLYAIWEDKPSEIVINHTDVANPNTNYANRTWTSDDISGTTLSAINSGGYFQFQKTSGSNACYIANTDAIPGPITKIEITKKGSSATTALDAYFSTTAISSKPASGAISESASDNVWTWNVDEQDELTYFYIVNGADDTKYFDDVTITYKKVSLVDPTGIVLDNANPISMDTYGYGNRKLVATVEPYNANNKTVTWGSNDESVVTISDGVLTPNGVGTTTVYAHTANYNPDSPVAELIKTVSVTVTQALYKKATFVPTSTSTASQADDYLSEGSVSFSCGAFSTDKAQLTTNNPSASFTISGYAGMKITGIDLVMASNGGAGTGSLTVTIGTTDVLEIATAPFSDASWNGAYDANPCYLYKDVTDYVVGSAETINFSFGCTVNSLYIYSVSVRYLDYKLEAWCEKFLANITCTGVTEQHPSGDIDDASQWDDLGLEFLDLPSDLKAIAETANADQYSENVIEQAMARYDLIVRKYGTSSYDDYIGRFGVGKVNGPLSIVNSMFATPESTTTTVVIIISVIGVSALGGFFFLRKRKEI